MKQEPIPFNRLNISEKKEIQAELLSLLLALGYFFICSLYIFFSSKIASTLSEDVSQLEMIETIKGIFFVAISSIVFFILSWYLLKRVSRNELYIAEQYRALIEADQRALAGTFAISIAHDMNNLLTIAKLSLEESSKIPFQPKQKEELLAILKKTVYDMSALSNRLLLLGKKEFPEHFVSQELGEFTQSLISFAKKHPQIKYCQIQFQTEASIVLNINTGMFQNIVLNLLLNAAEATNNQGKIEIILKKDHKNIFFEVHDNGPGIPPEKTEEIFELFYTSKPHGVGLGLLSVKACVTAHHGEINVFQSKLGGACFQLVFPLESEPEKKSLLLTP